MRLLTEREAARLLGCSIHKLQRDRRIGSPIPYVKIGRSVKYRLTDVESYLQTHSYTSTSQYQGGSHE